MRVQVEDYFGQFDFQNCRDLVEKLNRELIRFESAPNREDQADHAINFCMTAWHLIDWTLSAGQSGALTFSLTDGTEPNWTDVSEYRTYLFSRCSELRFMDVIANTWKHRVINAKPNRPEISVTASSIATMADWDRLSEISTLNQQFTWKLVEGEERKAWKHVFSAVSAFWHAFVYGETSET